MNDDKKETLRGTMGVYRIDCCATGRVYIGQSKNLGRRFGEHRSALRRGCHRNHALQADYDKYGADQITMTVVDRNPDTMDKVEADLIAEFTKENKCYNVFTGGLSGFTVNQEFRDKISRAHKGKKLSAERRIQLSEAAKKQWENQDYRNLMVKSAKKQWTDDNYRQIMHETHYGDSEANGHKLTYEIVRQARSEYAGGESVAELAKKYGVTYCTMLCALKGRSWRNA